MPRFGRSPHADERVIGWHSNRMVRSRYYDASSEAVVETALGTGWGVPALIEAVLAFSSGRGHPAAELTREDGSALSLGTDGELATLVWLDSLGDTHYSMGEGRGTHLVYDYFGSWSEASSDRLVPLEHAVEAMQQFAQYGSPVTERVIFQPD